MDWLIAIWNWLNGNKTIIGLVLTNLAALIPEGISVFGLFDLKAGILWLAGIFMGTGIVHKFVKANTDPGPNS